MGKKLLIIGAGGVGSVVAHKCAQLPGRFSEILLASRTVSKCDAVKAEVEKLSGRTLKTAALDADDPKEVARLIRAFAPDLVVHVALPYQDLSIMKACLAEKVDYLDTANYEPRTRPKFEYRYQWRYREQFRKAGVMALLGCGFDPGVTNVFTAYAAKHLFDRIRTLDILDCNAGSHGRAFATNFNPEINIREVTQEVRHWRRGRWIKTPPILDPQSVHFSFDYPGVGPKESYLLYHEELESLVQNVKGLERARFWMTFSENYLRHLDVIMRSGLGSIEKRRLDRDRLSPREFLSLVNPDYASLLGRGAARGADRLAPGAREVLVNLGFDSRERIPVDREIAPIEFLKKVLPDPQSLAKGYRGKTVIGNVFRGDKGGKERSAYIYNVCDHAECYREVRAQAISYTTGVPAMIGAALMLDGAWRRPGVYNTEELDPDPFMEMLSRHGLPWRQEEFSGRLYEE